MRLVLNGRETEAGDRISVAALLAREGEPAKHVLVEVNGEFVPPRTYETRVLAEGDRVEIILPAFGG